MKFLIKKITSSNVRLAQVYDFPKLPEKVFETPLLLLYTKGASIPHITHEVLQYVTKEIHCLLVSLPSTIQCFESLKHFKSGISTFAGLEEHITFCSVQDPGVLTPSGYNSKNDISIWAHSGRVILSPEKYMDIMEAFKPSMYEVLCDADTNLESSQKRCRKSLAVTESMFYKCLERHGASEEMKGSGLLASIQGGHDLDCRRRASQLYSNQPVDGFTLGGLHNSGSTAERVHMDKLVPVVTETLKYLPKDKPRVMNGCWNPQDVLTLMELGIDIFDSSLAYVATERQAALVFQYEASEPGETRPVGESAQNKPRNPMELILTESKYSGDLGAILEGCTCLACTKHSRAYIHHLINVKELLASTLLMIHNLHYYIEFFKFIRKSANEDRRVYLT